MFTSPEPFTQTGIPTGVSTLSVDCARQDIAGGCRPSTAGNGLVFLLVRTLLLPA
ncbi:MAG: hypothetical protein ACOX6D_07295 [Thermoguttaceae bacterium]